ncbi:MAG: hypothetical protein KGI97_04110 [Alphaproteobacteria bacterium]|nr:hypothetical protein [Alphaproteobacteria bacterium]
MRGSRTKHVFTRHVFFALALAGLALPAFAQTDHRSPAPAKAAPASAAAPAASGPPIPFVSSNRAASFLKTAPALSDSPAPAFSGLAMPPLADISTPVAQSFPATNMKTGKLEIATAALPAVSPESVGVPAGTGLGADMWKGTPRAMADALLAAIEPTQAPVLNDLARRALTTAAVAPEKADAQRAAKPAMPINEAADGDATTPPLTLLALRVGRLLDFADTADAWKLAAAADAGLIDDTTFHRAAATALAANIDPSLCGKVKNFAATYSGANWGEELALCQIEDKNTKAAQVSLDIMQARPDRDPTFLQVVNRNILGDSRTLPSQLTPLTPALLGALRLANLPLPGGVYGHPDSALIPALLALPAHEKVAQLSLAERAAMHGIIGADTLSATYKSIKFGPSEIKAPLNAGETGLRMRALLYQAALASQDPSTRIAYAAKFLNTAPVALQNVAGKLLADMAGSVKPDKTLNADALQVAQIYMLGGKVAEAKAWLAFAPADFSTGEARNLWPQFALAGMISPQAYASGFDTWLDAELHARDQQHARNDAQTAALLFDAAGLPVPAAAWARLLSAPQNALHSNLPPALLERLRDASAANRRAETVFLGAALAGPNAVSLPAAVEIARALRRVGLATEASSFARDEFALLTHRS